MPGGSTHVLSSVLAVNAKLPVMVPLVLGTLLVAAGCSSDGDEASTTTNPPVTSSPAPGTTVPFEFGVDSDFAPPPTEALYAAGDIDAGLQPFVDLAAADLAMWLGVDEATISTHAAVLVVWPDASLGCPLPDAQYPELALDGSIIELEHDGQIYRYHTGGQRGVFTCATPLADPPPSLDDEDDGVEL